MRKGYIVALPPGAGKTRIVLHKIKTLANNNWGATVNNMLVLGPNAKLKRIWLREIALAVADKRIFYEKDIRGKSERQLVKFLKDKYKISLKFKTYQNIKKCRNLKVPSFLVLDEWHRFNVFDHCKSFIEGRESPHILTKLSKGPYGNHTFFVSATPMNPVLEQEAENTVVEPKDDDKMITESRQKALYAIMGLLGNDGNEDICNKPFAEAVRKLGVKWIIKDSGWQKPKIRKNDDISNRKSILSVELKYLKTASDYERNGINDWKSKEASWAIGLVCNDFNRNSKSFELIKKKNRKNKKSFGFKYVDPFIATNCGNIKDSGKWLLEKHTRVRRLIERLIEDKIIEKNTDGKYTLNKKKKCLIFCIHQGVARGLQYALSQVIDNPKNENIACAVHEFDENTENNFNDSKKPPYILIATDKMSESIDLHGACNTIIHYELPWSPLRLLQRMGRLTRKHRRGNFNETYVYHVIIPGSVEEERINRLIRRTSLLADEGAWPKELGKSWKNIAHLLIGHGPSFHLKEETI